MDPFKQLFSDYTPTLSDSQIFMRRLQEKMEAMEMISQYAASLKRQSRRAALIAAVAGFVTGVCFASIFPYFSILIEHIVRHALPSNTPEISEMWILTIVFSIIGGVTLWAALSAYNLTFRYLAPKITEKKLRLQV